MNSQAILSYYLQYRVSSILIVSQILRNMSTFLLVFNEENSKFLTGNLRQNFGNSLGDRLGDII